MIIAPADQTIKVIAHDRFDARKRMGRLAARARHLLWALILLLSWGSLTRAHEIPYDLRVQMLLKAQGSRLSVLIRIPMSGLSESDLPLRGPGYLRLEAIEPALEAAAALALLDNLEIFENGNRSNAPKLTQIRVSLSSDKSFGTYDQALSHLRSPRLVDAQDLYWKQQYLDAAYDYEIGSADARFVVHPRFEKLGLKVVTVLQFQAPNQPIRSFEIHGDHGPIELDPSWFSATKRFGASGFGHILGGWDHLLFLICLILKRSKGKDLIWMATCFTVAHSITLISTALGLFPERLWFGPLVEFLIAVSIVLMAVESMFNLNDQWRLGLIFLFGLIHGFGFAFALSDSLQFSGSHLLTALFAFNLGVEAGQLVVLGFLAAVFYGLFKGNRPTAVVALVSLLVAHTGLHWAEQRYDVLKHFFPVMNWVS
jgi:hypothetical protein